MTTVLIGFTAALLAGVLNGSFAAPMRRMGKWEWENQWIMWAFWALIVCSWLLAWLTVPNLLRVYQESSADVILRTVLFGFAWGFGAISFGMGIHLLGLSLGFSIIVGITAVTGSLIPMLVVSPEMLWTRNGAMILLGLLITIVGVGLCGSAGMLRERGQQASNKDEKIKPKFKLGFFVCIASGILNAMLNLAFVFGAPLAEIAKTHMESSALVNFRAGNVIWSLALSGSFVSNFFYCGWLLIHRKSWKKFSEPGTGSHWFWTFLMGAMWMGGYALYGAGASTFGKLGPAVAWIILMASTVVTGNIWGFVGGEWKDAPAKARTRMIQGIAVLVASIIVVSLGS